ncbi:MAG: hypothetical protein ABIB71_00605 [Candidatus Woesearchaeota archaeon]
MKKNNDMKKASIVLVAAVLVLLLSGVASAGFFDWITGDFWQNLFKVPKATTTTVEPKEATVTTTTSSPTVNLRVDEATTICDGRETLKLINVYYSSGSGAWIASLEVSGTVALIPERGTETVRGIEIKVEDISGGNAVMLRIKCPLVSGATSSSGIINPDMAPPSPKGDAIITSPETTLDATPKTTITSPETTVEGTPVEIPEEETVPMDTPGWNCKVYDVGHIDVGDSIAGYRFCAEKPETHCIAVEYKEHTHYYDGATGCVQFAGDERIVLNGIQISVPDMTLRDCMANLEKTDSGCQSAASSGTVEPMSGDYRKISKPNKVICCS